MRLQGIDVKPLYTKADAERVADELPGQFPYTRGPYATMYTNRPWTIRQYAGFRYGARLLAPALIPCLQHCRGVQQVLPREPRCGPEGSECGVRSRHSSWVRTPGARRDASNSCTCSYDSDHPRVAGDVGMAGVAVDSVEDMKILFNGIPLDKVSVSMTMNGAVLPVMAMYVVAAEEQVLARSTRFAFPSSP